MNTPNFQGVHMYDRLVWARENLTPYQTDYIIVYENDIDEPCRVLHPSPAFMACAMNGGILPTLETYRNVRAGKVKGNELHTSKPSEAMTEEETISFLVKRDVPQHVQESNLTSNRNKILICKRDKLPKTRVWRNAWVLSGDKIEYNNKMAVNIFKDKMAKAQSQEEIDNLLESWEQVNGNG
jgi:hypothetical protein